MTTYGYDANDNVTSLEDASGNVSTFAYDKLNRLTGETDPLGKTLSYAYDAAGRLTTATDRQGRQRAYTYDAADRPTAVAWYSAASSLLQTQTFGYDAAGELTSATDPDGSYAITRDALGRAAVVDTPSGVTLTFTYDAAGNRTSVADSTGGTQTSTFDLADRLTSRTLDAPTGDDVRVDYTYTARDEVATATRYSDLTGTTQEGVSRYTYDAGGRLTDLEHRTGPGAGTLIADYAYQYDLDGRLTQKTENSTTTTYGYDDIGQLTSVGSAAYSYDATGNRTMSGYVTGDGNRMTSDGTWTYTYDLDGNLTGKSKSGESWAYAYDLNGQMTSADHPVGGSAAGRVEYAYDAFGNRVERKEYNGSSVLTADAEYVLDGWDTAKPGGSVGTEAFDAVLDLDGSGNVTDRRLFGAGFDDVVADRTAAGGTAWYATDRLGSVRAAFDNSGTVSGAADYDAFGGFLGGVPVDRYAFTGREYDSTLGLQYSRGRMYDSATGRWTGEDSVRQTAGDPNLYRYVGNGATNATDPSGNWLITKDKAAADAWVKHLKDVYGIDAFPKQLASGRWFIFIPYDARERLLEKLKKGVFFDDKAAEEYLGRMTSSAPAGLKQHLDGVLQGGGAAVGGKDVQLTPEETQEILTFIAGVHQIYANFSVPDVSYLDAVMEGLGEGFKNLKDAAKKIVQEAYEVAGAIVTDPIGFAKEMAQALYLLATDSEVRSKLVGEIEKEWRENPSKALLKVGLGLLAGAGGQRLIGPVKTLLKAKSAKLLKTLKGKLSARGEKKIQELAERAGKTTDPKELERINGELEQIEKQIAKGLTGCFAAGTPILTPDGPRAIESLVPGDTVLTADQDDLACRVVVGVVAQVFRRLAPVGVVRAGGRDVRMTPGHPLWVDGRGWVAAGELVPGDRVRGHDGRYTAVDAVEPAGEAAVVYNVEVAGSHTFFVGGAGWGFSLWVHNDELCDLLA